MVYIENDGALFRGPSGGLPTEVWFGKRGAWVAYKFEGRFKPEDWGTTITETDAVRMMMQDVEPDAQTTAAFAALEHLCGEIPEAVYASLMAMCLARQALRTSG